MSRKNKKLSAVIVSLTFIGLYFVLHPILFAASFYGATTYTSWYFPAKSGGYDSISWDVKPEAETGSSNGIFWAQYTSFIGGQESYLGIQNVGNEPTGKIATFSIWGATGASGSEYAKAFGGSGARPGYSVRIRYNWAVGRTYTLKIAFSHNGTNGNWWKATITDRTSNETKEIGLIQVPPDWQKLESRAVSFTENYLGLSDCSQLKFSSAFFSGVHAEANTQPSRHTNTILQQHGGGTLCPGGSYSFDGNGGVHHWLGSQNAPPSPTPNPSPTPTPTPTPSPAPANPDPTPEPQAPPDNPEETPVPPATPTAQLLDTDGNELAQTDDGLLLVPEDTSAIITGTSIPLGRISLYFSDGRDTISIEADEQGEWKHMLSSLAVGTYTVEAEATDPKTSLTSDRSRILAFFVGTSEQAAASPDVRALAEEMSEQVATQQSKAPRLAASLALITTGIVSGLWLWPKTKHRAE